MKNNHLNYLLALSLLSLMPSLHAETEARVTEEVNGKVKLQTIRTEDRFATIEEERVQAIASTVQYLPANGGAGYSLVGSDMASTSVKSAHSDSDEMMIPSWQVFSW